MSNQLQHSRQLIDTPHNLHVLIWEVESYIMCEGSEFLFI